MHGESLCALVALKTSPRPLPVLGFCFFWGFVCGFAGCLPCSSVELLLLLRPRLNSLPRPEIESTFLALLPFPRAIESPAFYSRAPRARCMPFLGSGLPLIPVFGFVLEVFNSGFESRPPREIKFTVEFGAGPV